jgi:HD-GYP domain-containing protein (c-di-GMP phosphodiesterase class II)
MVESYGASTQRMCKVYDRLVAGQGIYRESMEEIAGQAVADLTEDMDLFTGIAANVPGGDDYPARHSTHVAQLSLALGVQLGLDVPTLRELVIGALVHDAGMLLLDRSVFDGPHVLTPVAFLEVTKHSILVFDMLRDVSAIPKRSAFIAYQVHERCDGSGYPRRRVGNQIHFLSRIAAVADTYVALVSPRQHRPAMMPYHAMERVLRDAARGLYDRDVVRAMLRVLSLFPIGSYIQLKDGREGRVLRAGDDYTRPVVEVYDPAKPGAPEVLDLGSSKHKYVSVARPLATLSARIDVAPAEAAATA